MVKNRIRSYWLVLLVLLMCANLVLSVEPSRAHYTNTATWNTVVEAEENAVTSKYLVKTSAAPLTVLVGEIAMDDTPVEITLDSARDITGSLSCSVDHPEYLNVILCVEEQNEEGETIEMAVEADSEILLKAGASTKVIMHMVSTKLARVEAQEPRELNVTLTWDNSLQGTFRVILPVVEAEPEATEPEATEPEATEPEATEPEVTEPEATEPEVTEPEATEPEATEPEATEPEATEPEATEPEATEPTTPEDTETTTALQTDSESASDTAYAITAQASRQRIVAQAQAKKTLALLYDNTPEAAENLAAQTAETAAETEAQTITEPVALTVTETETEPTETEPTETEPTETEPTEATEPDSTEEQTQQFRMESMAQFAPTQLLPVTLYPTDEMGYVRLGMGTVAEEQITLANFPKYTCYSLDGGESYFMLYEEGALELGRAETISVLLDLSRLEQTWDADLTLAAEGYTAEDLLVSSAAVTATPHTAAFYQMDTRFLTKDTAMKITLDSSWKDYPFTYTVQLLEGSEAEDTEQTTALPEFRTVDASLWTALDQENYAITLQIKDVLPTAGTYRVQLQWFHGDTCIAREQATFFINYAAVYTESEETGGAEQ